MVRDSSKVVPDPAIFVPKKQKSFLNSGNSNLNHLGLMAAGVHAMLGLCSTMMGLGLVVPGVGRLHSGRSFVEMTACVQAQMRLRRASPSSPTLECFDNGKWLRSKVLFIYAAPELSICRDEV